MIRRTIFLTQCSKQHTAGNATFKHSETIYKITAKNTKEFHAMKDTQQMSSLNCLYEASQKQINNNQCDLHSLTAL